MLHVVPSATTADRELTLERYLPASPEQVYAAFTDPEHLPRWWGPKGFSCTTKHMDLRVGGSWVFDMVGPDGHVWPNRIQYVALTPPSELRYVVDGGSDSDEQAFSATVRLTPSGGGTLLRMHMVLASPEHLAAVKGFGAVELGYTTLDKLQAQVERTIATEVLPDEPTVVIHRRLRAPRALVWRCLTEAEHIRHWWGSAAMPLTTCELDFRVGGQWRFVVGGSDGQSHGFHGTFQQITPIDGYVQTFVYEPFPDSVATETIELLDADGETRLRNTIRHPTFQARDGHVSTGMEEGARTSMDRLAVLLDRLQA